MVSVSLECTTPSSPVAQIFDAMGEDGAQYTPDRTLFPTVLLPKVVAGATDGSWTESVVNSKLANIKWFANGVDISTSADWAGLYSIQTADDDSKGELTVNRNIGVNDVVELKMQAELVDTREMKLIKISSEPITLTTSARSEGTFALEMQEGNVLYYDVTEDQLALDDYNRAHELKALTDEERAAVKSDRFSYLREIPIKLKRGAHEITSASNIHYKIYRVSSDGTLTELGNGFDEILKVPPVGGNPKIDMRLCDGGCYMIRAFLGTGSGAREIARAQFQTKRLQRKLRIQANNSASMCNGDKMRTDVAIVKCGRRVVVQPDRFMKIRWKSETSSGKQVTHNIGSTGKISLVRAGVATAASDGITEDLEVWCEGEMKPVHSFVQANGKYMKINNRPLIIS